LSVGVRACLRARRESEYHRQKSDNYQTAEVSRGSERAHVFTLVARPTLSKHTTPISNRICAGSNREAGLSPHLLGVTQAQCHTVFLFGPAPHSTEDYYCKHEQTYARHAEISLPFGLSFAAFSCHGTWTPRHRASGSSELVVATAQWQREVRRSIGTTNKGFGISCPNG
jgi:hypothetical protein